MRFLHLDIMGAVKLNPNVIFSMLFLTICPILLLIDGIGKKNLILLLFTNIESLLHKKVIWIPFSAIEILIWLHNIMTNV